jgi:hypothetical protein
MLKSAQDRLKKPSEPSPSGPSKGDLKAAFITEVNAEVDAMMANMTLSKFLRFRADMREKLSELRFAYPDSE